MQRAKSSAWPARAAPGKSLTAAAVIGLLPPPGRIAGGEIRLEGERLDTLGPEAMRRVRGARIGAIFQDPLGSLDPLFTIGDQLIETIRALTPANRAQARDRAVALLTEVGMAKGYPQPGAASAQLSPPVFRRHAPARRDRAWRSPAIRG